MVRLLLEHSADHNTPYIVTTDDRVTALYVQFSYVPSLLYHTMPRPDELWFLVCSSSILLRRERG